ncbi:MAG: hypothetical protein NXY57DRAFT_1044399 [Lentinula lateritia]|nr:MAG: hypothetical protein NXY57DRAFT_1044399 [Lentinula lateritia]
MNSSESRNVQESYEAFGVLRRLTEDNMLPGFRLKVPMMIVLDTLKNEEPNLRRIGETWMRCSLKSFHRVLNPILFELMDPSIRRSISTMKVKGKEITGFTYERPFDQRYINHLLDMLASVIRIGGQGFVKTARMSGIKRSHHSGLVTRVESYLLRAIIAREEISGVSIDVVEAAIISKFYFCVHTDRPALQNNSYISFTRRITVGNQRPEESLTSGDGDEHARGYSMNPLLTQTLVDGIITPTNQSVFQHWLDFVLMAIPQFQPMYFTSGRGTPQRMLYYAAQWSGTIDLAELAYTSEVNLMEDDASINAENELERKSAGTQNAPAEREIIPSRSRRARVMRGSSDVRNRMTQKRRKKPRNEECRRSSRASLVLFTWVSIAELKTTKIPIMA